jgi:hypothetical protein
MPPMPPVTTAVIPARPALPASDLAGAISAAPHCPVTVAAPGGLCCPGVCANFVGSGAFLLVADLIWMHSHIQMRNLLVSASYTSHAACDEPIWQAVRIQT